MTVEASNLVDFLIVGAPRSGTTWLNDCLWRHPDIWVPPKKELHFFDSRAGLDNGMHVEHRPAQRLKRFLPYRGRHYYSAVAHKLGLSKRLPAVVAQEDLRCDLAWDLKFFSVRSDIRWYASLFSAAKKKGFVIGEATPTYMLLPDAEVSRIRDLCPTAMIIFVLRNPVDRVISSFVRTSSFARMGGEVERLSRLPFDEFLRSDHSRLRADYVGAVSRWRRIFGGERVRVLILERLLSDPLAPLRALVEGLGLDPDRLDTSFVTERRNESSGRLAPAKRQQLEEIAREFYAADIHRMVDYFGDDVALWQARRSSQSRPGRSSLACGASEARP